MINGRIKLAPHLHEQLETGLAQLLRLVDGNHGGGSHVGGGALLGGGNVM